MNRSPKTPSVLPRQYIEEYTLLYLAAFLIVLVGVAHSYLGERYILMRLFRRGDLPKLFGGTEFTKNTLRFAWHVTTVAWLGFSCILIYMAYGHASQNTIINIIGLTFAVHFLIALIASKGKHLSWLVFLGVALSCFYASST